MLGSVGLRAALVGVLAASLSALTASTALAQASEGAQKAPIYGPVASLSCEGGLPTPNTFGFAVMNTPGNETTLTGEVALKHAAPNTTYTVAVDQIVSVPLCMIIPVEGGFITTNRKGNGNLHFSTERTPGATKFWVNIKSAAEELSSPAVELD